MLTAIRAHFHSIGVILSIILLLIDEPGFDTVTTWCFGSLFLNAVLLIPILPDARVEHNARKQQEL